MANLASDDDFNNRIYSPSNVYSGSKKTGVVGYDGYGISTDTKGNVRLGIDSGKISTGKNNLFFGKSSAMSLSTGDDNLIFGFNSGSNLIYGSGNILFGKNTTTSTSSAQNQIIFGNNQTGNGDNSVTFPPTSNLFCGPLSSNNSLFVKSNGKVCIGTSSADVDAILTVNGSIKCTSITTSSESGEPTSTAKIISIFSGPITTSQLGYLNVYLSNFQARTSREFLLRKYYPNISYNPSKPFSGSVYVPSQNRIYLVPRKDTVSDSGTWKFIDCNTGTFLSYNVPTISSITSGQEGYLGGCYSPVDNKIYLAPYEMSSSPTWHRIRCDDKPDGIVESYAAPSTGTNLYSGCVYSPSPVNLSNSSLIANPTIYFIPSRLNNITQLHKVNPYTGVCSVYSISANYTAGDVTTGYSGGVYSPTQHRIYLVPSNQVTKSQYHYINCTTGEFTAYNHGLSKSPPMMGCGAFSPTENRIYMFPNSGNQDTYWMYIDCTDGTVHEFPHLLTIPSTWFFTGAIFSPVHNRIYLTAYTSLQSSNKVWYFIDCTTSTAGFYTFKSVGDANDLELNSSFYSTEDNFGGSYSPTENKIYFINSLTTTESVESSRWTCLEEGGNFPVDKWLMGHTIFN